MVRIGTPLGGGLPVVNEWFTMSRTSLVRKAAALTAAVGGLAVAVTATLATSAVAAPSQNAATASRAAAPASSSWFVDPRTPAQRKAQIAVPNNPKAYRGKLRETRAVYRTRSGSLAVPIRKAAGHQLAKGQAVTLDGDGLFARNSPKLTAAAKRQLTTLGTSLGNATSVRCEGYTDHSGSKTRNRELAKKRAAAVCGQLVANVSGLKANSVGYGSTRPAVVGGTVAQRKLNRRVVIEMTGAKPAAPQAQVPGAPELVYVDQVRNGFRYAFRAPQTDGGSPITGYQVSTGGAWSPVTSAPRRMAASGPSACLADCGEDLIRGDLWGLTTLAEVEVQVRAVNKVGAGAPSNGIDSVVADLPGAPTNLVATASGTQVILNFNLPAGNGLEIWGYELKIDEGDWGYVSPTYGSLTLQNQTPGTHVYQLRAINMIGTGEASTSNAVTIAPPGPQVYRSESYYSQSQYWTSAFFFEVPGAVSYEVRLDGGDWLPFTIESSSPNGSYGYIKDPACQAGGCTMNRTVEMRAILADGPGAVGNAFTSNYVVLG